MTATLGRLGLLEARLLLVAGVTNRIRLLWVRNILRADGSRAAVPVDLTGWNPRLQLRRDGKVLADLSDCVTLDSHGHVDVSVQTNAPRRLCHARVRGTCCWKARRGK